MTMKEYPCTYKGVPGVLRVETTTGTRPDDRHGWKLYSSDTKTKGRVWEQTKFIPTEKEDD